MYSVAVAADCNGDKVNLQFFFEFGPSVAQVLSRASEAFRALFRQRGIDRIFVTSASVIFNDALECWDRLDRSTQLVHNCQLYIFQPDVLDIPAEIGDPIPASTFLGDYYSPAREASHSQSPRPTPPSSYAPRSLGQAYASPLYAASYETTTTTTYQKSSAFVDHSAATNPYSFANATKHHYERNPNFHEGSESILRQERDKMERQSHMPLDDLRNELRREAKEYSVSPDRRSAERQY
ncbi:Hypothetical protein, putative [Bodo saltans]|uniref:BILBO1 N-terminal domain-containing protein n=1 Tax=Bodo saltans TaxID=75058 RepID=A0A0S4JNL3_BODSA|nr:Hypothetical protein, putative [Bodo saltans]|eukprot:CUG91487.1 Hypothetical protein, putative [Bodo saltans]